MNHSIEPAILEKAKLWLTDLFDDDTRNEIKKMMEEDPESLTDAFYKDLEFGTGGLRGIMGAGTNRMNRYTIGMATQGLANYLLKEFNGQKIKVAIAYDSRINSALFARIAAEVLSANNIYVYLFDALRPTPELSFAVRQLQCQGGIVITASHNPKEYNGYKVYWDDGAQLVAPHDKNVITEVRKIGGIDQVKFEAVETNIEIIGAEIDQAYIENICSTSLLAKEEFKKYGDIKIVFSPIHGTGTKLVPETLKAFGFTNIISVEEQSEPDGNFPTVHSPNPEEAAALNLSITKAKATNAGLVMATDPDADRVGIAVLDEEGEFILLNGNQTASILIYYLLSQWSEQGKLDGRQYIVKTIVTTGLLQKIAESYGVDSYNTLTGFKYIAEVIRDLEGSREFIGGGEESYGYLIGDFVRDKDAVSSCCMIAEAAAWAASRGTDLHGMLREIHLKYGLYLEKLKSITRKGKKGAEEIQAMMTEFRTNPPAMLAGVKVTSLRDYQSGIEKNLDDGSEKETGLPSSNVLQFELADESQITVRPSGTEPKIKFYFSVIAEKPEDELQYDEKMQELDEKIEQIISDLDIG